MRANQTLGGVLATVWHVHVGVGRLFIYPGEQSGALSEQLHVEKDSDASREFACSVQASASVRYSASPGKRGA